MSRKNHREEFESKEGILENVARAVRQLKNLGVTQEVIGVVGEIIVDAYRAGNEEGYHAGCRDMTEVKRAKIEYKHAIARAAVDREYFATSQMH